VGKIRRSDSRKHSNIGECEGLHTVRSHYWPVEEDQSPSDVRTQPSCQGKTPLEFLDNGRNRHR